MLTKTARKQIIAGLVLMALTSACAPAASPTPTITPTETETATPTATDTATSTPTATASATPTATASLTPTKAPTRKPATTAPQPTEAVEATATVEGATAEATEAATEQPTAEPTTPPAEGDNFAPTVAQVWQLDTNPISKSSTDACGGELAVDFYGLVAVRPDGDNLIWHRQDGNDYVLVRSGLNHYAGSGPSSVPDFSLSISITFTSATTLIANHTLTSISNADCKHTYKYNGKFNWNS